MTRSDTSERNASGVQLLRTEILVNASSQKVWEVLTDFKKYPDWNPFIRSLKGEVKKGNKLQISLQPPDGMAMKFRPRVLAFETAKEFRWLGHLFFPGLFDGEHFFLLTDHHNGTTTVVQGERFSGILVPLFKKMIDKNTRAGFEEMNRALKEQAERV